MATEELKLIFNGLYISWDLELLLLIGIDLARYGMAHFIQFIQWNQTLCNFVIETYEFTNLQMRCLFKQLWLP